MSSSINPSNDNDAIANEGIVNSMTRPEIIYFIADMKKKDDPNAPSRGRKMGDRPPAVQRRCFFTGEGDLLVNPTSFSWTKSAKDVKDHFFSQGGYPTLPLRCRTRKLKEQKKKATSENGSSTPASSKYIKVQSFTRVLVHHVMWRFWNDFKQIPKGKEISHLSGNRAVGKRNLCAEDGARNKHRIGCHRLTIKDESCKCGVPSKGIPHCVYVQYPETEEGERELFDILQEDTETVRDKKAASKAFPSSGEIKCEDCLCVKKAKIDLDNCPIEEVFNFCLCDAQRRFDAQLLKQSLCDTPGCGNPAS